MTQTARVPAPTRAIDLYLSATTSRIDRAVADLVLAEPTARDLDLAARTIDRLIETLAGLAIGSVVGAALAGVRRSFGAEVRGKVDRAAARAINSIGSPEISPLHGIDAAPVRSLAIEVQQRLRRRNAFTVRDTRVLLLAIGAAIDERPVFDRVLGVIADDPTIAERYAVLVAAGWQCATAVIEGRVVEASAAVWGQWAARIGGRAPAKEPTQEQLVAAGFVMRIG
jgi:hypothetical protein